MDAVGVLLRLRVAVRERVTVVDSVGVRRRVPVWVCEGETVRDGVGPLDCVSVRDARLDAEAMGKGVAGSVPLLLLLGVGVHVTLAVSVLVGKPVAEPVALWEPLGDVVAL